MDTLPPFHPENVAPPDGYLETLAGRVIQRRKRQLRQRLVAGICALLVVGGWLSWRFFGPFRQGPSENLLEPQQEQMAQNTPGGPTDTGKLLLKPTDTIPLHQWEKSSTAPSDTPLTREQIIEYLIEENFFDS
ncbi:MAG: hypothetical protein N2110_09270 [Flavobacteriales bacterium]|nr:hypothetical protein [Flavobacteriales bacterium]MCX7769192.1 hypothetical protein [Flavobacteriales bacterium]MDW8410708.1 hypothetical protein [Flavobacteriales bacterium]